MAKAAFYHKSTKMAFLQKKNDVYYLCEKSKVQGKWKLKWIKIGPVPYAKAKAVLARYEADNTYLRLGIETGHGLTLKTLFDLYMQYQTETPTKKPQSLNNERKLLQYFMTEFGNVAISKFDCDAVNAWFVKHKYEPNTVRLYIAALKQLYNLAMKRGYLKVNPLTNLHRPKLVQKPPRYATDDVINAVFAELSPDVRPLFEIMLYSGLRPSEAMRLKVENIRLKAKMIDLYPDQTKTADRGLIPIHRNLVPVFEKLISGKKHGQWLFAGDGKTGHQVECKKALQGACRRASQKAGYKIHLTSYQLRHTFATRILEKTGDLRAVQQLLRHANISMTTRYATTVEQKLKDAIDSI